MHGIIENSDPNSRDPFSNPSFHDHLVFGNCIRLLWVELVSTTFFLRR
jgi:hypothetical protein